MGKVSMTLIIALSSSFNAEVCIMLIFIYCSIICWIMSDMPVCALSKVAKFLSNFYQQHQIHLRPVLSKWVVVICSGSIIKDHVCVCVYVCVIGNTMDRITVYCSSGQELQDWLDNLQPFTKGGSPAGTIAKVILQTRQQTWNFQHAQVWKPSNHCPTQTVEGKPLSMVGGPTHMSHLGSFSALSRGPLEPPKISKPWSLSCLRPAPPLKPSAALGYKEVGGWRPNFAAAETPTAWLYDSY